MKDEKIDEIKIRYRCSNCKNLESHHMSTKKRKCKKCGESLKEISEKDYHHYKHKLKKEHEEDKKETSNKNKEKEKDKDKDKDKEKKKNQDKTEEKSEKEKESVKPKHKLKKNLSTKNLDDKSYKIKKEEEKEIKTTNKSKKDDSKKKNKKKKNRHKSVEKVGSAVSNVVSNLFNNPNELGGALIGLNELDLSSLAGTTIVVNSSNLKSQVLVNNEEIDTDVFDPIFNSFGVIFDDNFVNNFLQNFQSSNGENYHEEIQNLINDNQQYGIENDVKPVKKNVLKKLKKFKLTEKYCKKDKKEKLELPNCCICLSEIELGKDALLLPCGHLFHYKCCCNWLKTNNTCPMCRFEIK